MDMKNKARPDTEKELPKFSELKCGQLFTVPASNEPKKIWCKTPFADMYEHNNPYSADGAFCTAVCVNSDKPEYMQCWPDAKVRVVKIEKIVDAG